MTLEKASSWSDIFEDISSERAVKGVYRVLVKKYHPDNVETGNIDMLNKLDEYYKLALLHVSGSREVEKGLKVINFKAGNKVIKFNYNRSLSVGGCEVYYSESQVALVFAKDMYDLADRYIEKVNELSIKDEQLSNEYFRIMKMCMVNVEERVKGLIILKKKRDVVNLGEVVDLVESGKLDWSDRDKHAVWIMNRVYSWWAYVHDKGQVFMGFDIHNMFISPMNHLLMPLIGWQFTVEDGGDIVGTTSSVLNVIDSKTRREKKAKSYIDGEAIKQIGRTLFKGCSWEDMDTFLNEAASDEPEKDWDRFTDIFMMHYGARKFYDWAFDLDIFYNKEDL